MTRSLCTLMAALLATLSVQADPLECIPKTAGVVIKIESPRALVEGAVKLDAWQELQAFPQVKEALADIKVRRFFQVLKYVESATDTKWPDLIDKVAGHGIAIGLQLADDKPPMLAVIEGSDAAMVAEVYAIFVAGVRDEASRNPAVKLTDGTRHGVATLTVGDDFHAAQAGARILFSNNKQAMEAGLTLAVKKKSKLVSVLKHPTLEPARKLVGTDAAAWLWFDLAAAKQTAEGKAFFETVNKDVLQLLLLGSSLDAAARCDYLVVGLYAKSERYTLSVRLPAKRMGLGEGMKLHVPAGRVGAKPLLEPPGVVFSQSNYIDLGYLWKHRATMIADEKVRTDIEKSFEDISKLLPGTSVGQILEGIGPHHRIVMAQTGEKLYGRDPGQPIPPTAYVLSLRDPEVAKSLDGVLRAGGLLAGFQTGWKMTESRSDGVKVVTYTFPENGDPKFDDADNLRFNTAPSFALAHGSLVVGSTPGIVKAILPLLNGESEGVPEAWRMKIYAPGIANVLEAQPDATITDTVLTQGITLAEARKQVLELSKWIRGLGAVTILIDHGEHCYRTDLEWKFK